MHKPRTALVSAGVLATVAILGAQQVTKEYATNYVTSHK
jgi:hypothetical protein